MNKKKTVSFFSYVLLMSMSLNISAKTNGFGLPSKEEAHAWVENIYRKADTLGEKEKKLNKKKTRYRDNLGDLEKRPNDIKKQHEELKESSIKSFQKMQNDATTEKGKIKEKIKNLQDKYEKIDESLIEKEKEGKEKSRERKKKNRLFEQCLRQYQSGRNLDKECHKELGDFTNIKHLADAIKIEKKEIGNAAEDIRQFVLFFANK